MADLGEKAAKQLGEITECPICMNAFSDPRMLPCIHTFCFECLRSTAEAAEKKPGDRMPCPLCRRDFTIPEDGMIGVQKNFFVENLLEFKTTMQTSSSKIICDTCNARNKIKSGERATATMRCVECSGNYCDSCAKVHQFQKLGKNHRMLFGGNAKSETKRLYTRASCCKIQKPLDYYCADCKKIVCISCFVESHASHKCKDVTIVDEEFRQTIQRNSSKVSNYVDEMLYLKKKEGIRKADFMKEIVDKEKNNLYKKSKT